jgi:AcrR family transcriptional regulator
MSPRSKQQFEAIRRDRKESIKEAAMQLFAERGFAEVSISRIAQKAGVSKGLLYNYFTNKEALVKEIVLEGFRRMMEKLDFDFDKEITRERFIELINKDFDLLEKELAYWSLYISVITQPAVTALVKEEIFEVVTPFLNALTTYYAKNNVKNPEVQSLLLGAVLDGVAIDYMLGPKEYPLQAIKELIIKKFI